MSGGEHTGRPGTAVARAPERLRGEPGGSAALPAYRVTYIACRVCGADRPKLLGTRGNLEYSGAPPLRAGESHMVTNVVRCRTCHFVYTNPLILLPEEDGRQQYHDAEGYRPYANDPSRALGARLQALERLVKRRGRLLDVGAGKGEFLVAARGRGWEVHGIEPSGELARHAKREHDLTLQTVPFTQTAFPGESFDAVTLNMVLEHVEDPVGVLREARRVLVPGGVVCLEVPNLESLLLGAITIYFRLTGRDWSPLLSPLHWPYHTYGYCLRTIRHLCEQVGFAIVKAQATDLGCRGFRDSPGITVWEAWSRHLVMKLGARLGRGDVLIVYGEKRSQPMGVRVR